MNRFFFALLSLSLFLPSFAHAQTNGRLIKGPNSSAVYYSIDTRRFAFPNEAIFRSWYTDFSQVSSVSREELAQFRLAGAVAFQPGSLIKLTTDPKVYAVDHLAKLRWITNESTARALYGDQWAHQVKDLPDAFFSGYTIVDPIENATQWNPTQAAQTNNSIAVNQELLAISPTTPATPSTPTAPSAPTSTTPIIPERLVISVTPSPIRLGDTVLVRAFAVGSQPMQSISLVVNGTNVVCHATPCIYTYTVPIYSAPSQLHIQGEAVFIDQTRQTVNGLISITGQAQGALRLEGSSTEVKRGNAPEWTATWADQNTLPARITFFLDGNELKTCYNARECRYNEMEASPVGTTHAIYAKAFESGGQEWTTPTTNFSVVTNPHPTLTFSIEKETIYTGEITTVSAQASDDTNIARLQFFVNNQLVKTCSALNCSTPIGPWNAEGFVILKAVAEDSTGLTTERSVRLLVLPTPAR